MEHPFFLEPLSRRNAMARFAGVAAAAAPGGLFSMSAEAQVQPGLTRVVMPFPSGNSVDVSARVLVAAMGRVSSRQMFVENKPGASGMLGTTEVVRGKPDGSVLLYTTGGLMTNAVLFKKAPYDVMKDLTPITQVSVSPGFMLLVRKDSPYQSLSDFMAAARARPGTISYGSAGIGNTTHLVGELVSRSADIKLLHVPYKGSPDPDVIGGTLDCMFTGTSLALPLMASGRLRALAVTANERVEAAPSVPTFHELGFKDVDVPAYSAVWAPAGMKPDMALSIRNDFVKAAADPSFQRQMQLTASAFVGSTPSEFRHYLELQLATLQRVLSPLGIVLE